MAWGSRLGKCSIAIAALFFLLFGVTAQAQQKPAAAAPPAPKVVSVVNLQTQIPTIDGWTRAPLSGQVVTISEASGYSFAEGNFTKGDMKVKLTVGDTVAVDDCLMALAALVVVLPAGYSQKVPAGSEISRFEFGGGQAASKWNPGKLEGEFSVVINGRFVVKAEGSGLDSMDTLKDVVSRVDLKKLSELKPGK